MQRASIFVFLGAGALFAAGCPKPSDHACGKDPKIGCLCQSEPYRLRAGEQSVKECGEPAASLLAYRCCFDRDAAGMTTKCRCESAVCVATAAPGECACGMRARLGEVGNVVAACEGRCCKKADRCVCGEPGECTDGARVDRCTNADVKPPACAEPTPHEARSCEHLAWKSKA